MISVSPRPVVVRVHKTWQITPGMSFSVAEDINSRVWIVESCPAGTQFWNLAQASMLTGGDKTGDPLECAIALGRQLQAKLLAHPTPRKHNVRIGMPAADAHVRTVRRSLSAVPCTKRELVPA